MSQKPRLFSFLNIRGGEDNSQVCDGFNSSSVIRRNVTLKDAEDDDLNPSEYQLLMDDEDPETDIPNLIYPFTIIMTICTVSTAAYLSLSIKAEFKYLKYDKRLSQSAVEYRCLFTKL